MSVSWSMYQGATIAGEAGRATSRSEHVADEVVRLSQKLDALALLCQAQWEIIRDNTGLSDEDIAKKAQEIDLRDGAADGKMGRVKRTCNACNRPLHRRHDTCLYCGAAQGRTHQFDV
ncbi:MAG: hypothetical protein PF961_15220 [Planctomycetota bacterium]|jgi:hypothetical protein|nr:hypothetical protein [Planctomycetota bacterium]